MDCSICLKNIENGYKLSCDHDTFHKECIETWLKIKPTCPLCRKNVVSRILIWHDNIRTAAEIYKMNNNLPHLIEVISNFNSKGVNDIVYHF